jgi:aspartate aminotransferase
MISKKIREFSKSSSMIRAMFEEGNRLKKLYGDDNVFDLSIGNPEIEPPETVQHTITELAESYIPGKHRYMSNAGYDFTRSAIAEYVNKYKGSHLTANHVVMTVGAAGALNVVLKTILDPGDEVIVFSPYFVEYGFYIDNYEGKTVTVPTDSDNFEPNPDVLYKAITKNTKAILINNPNNPTGVIYSEKVMQEINGVIEKRQAEFNTTIYVLSDEPYDRIVYDGATVPSIFRIFKNSIIVNSFSKSLALPGERIGYIAVNDKMEDFDQLMSGLILCNRILGYVNAPAFMQRVVAQCCHQAVEPSVYQKRRDLLYNHLIGLGFSCVKPQGAFYLFPKTLIEDDVEFANRATKYNLLVVPGTGFGCPGHIRISYCVSMKTLEGSLNAFDKLVNEFR